MEHTFTKDSIISDIVTKFPKSTHIFTSHKIDFCCGGNRPLIDAIIERNLPADEFITKLNTLYNITKLLNETEPNWATASYHRLIDHIINKHHCYLNEELPDLSNKVTKLLRVHGAEHSHLTQIHKLFHELKTELEQHLIKEETVDFPLILEFEQNPSNENRIKLQQIVDELEIEHHHAGDIIKELRVITNDFIPPEDACNTYRTVYQRLEALESDLFEHIHLENNILFPRAIKQI